jgi:hypothetical protein
MGDKPDYAALATEAHTAVKDLDASDEYKLAGYKIILSSLIGSPVLVHTKTGHAAEAAKTRPPTGTASQDSGDWTNKIADALGMTIDEIAEIYYFDGENLKLLVGRKQLPSSASSGTQHIAALVAAGRQAMGLDENGTEFELIKPVLKTHNVFNTKNWTTYIKQLGSKFIYDGSGKKQTIKLTNKAYDVVAEIARTYVETE